MSSRIARFAVCPLASLSRLRYGAAISRKSIEPSIEKPRSRTRGPQPVLPRRVVLLEEAERGERGDVAMRRAAGQIELSRELADAQRGPIRPKRREDGESTLERLGAARAVRRLPHFRIVERRLDNSHTPCLRSPRSSQQDEKEER